MNLPKLLQAHDNWLNDKYKIIMLCTHGRIELRIMIRISNFYESMRHRIHRQPNELCHMIFKGLV